MEDKQIVDLFWVRSESAIQEAAKKYKRYLQSIAYNILGSAEDAEECVNDTLFKAWNSIPENRPVHLSAYLGKIARNLSINGYNKRNTQKRGGQTELILDELAECIPSPDDILETLESERLSALISEFLRGLPEQIRNIFVRRYWYSDSVAEISAMYGISGEKVKSALFRCRNKLKAFLEKEEYF